MDRSTNDSKGQLEDLMTIEDFERESEKNTEPKIWRYVSHGAGIGQTLKRNCEYFQRYLFRPRVMRDVSQLDMGTTLLGEHINSPICVGVTTAQDKMHVDAELATAKASRAHRTCMVVSTWSSVSMDDVATVEGLKWFQIHPFHHREETTRRLVTRAENCGYKAIVLTIDSRVVGREFGRLMSSGGFGFTPLHELPNLKEFGKIEYHDPSASWEYVDWLKTITNLPIVIKGILTAESANEAIQHGADGIIVSNQGARHLDGMVASIEALPEVAKAINGRCEVYLDSGIRRGTDIIKALALGARAVFVGRPILWGLACGGEAGVDRVLTLLEDELSNAMALCGVAKVADIDNSLVRHDTRPHVSKY
ncbi:unnamed protein product [Owenia fusiformis]|nr:unnamed protein product [Owenia fusiformis]